MYQVKAFSIYLLCQSTFFLERRRINIFIKFYGIKGKYSANRSFGRALRKSCGRQYTASPRSALKASLWAFVSVPHARPRLNHE
jgi:hypothetical protein